MRLFLRFVLASAFVGGVAWAISKPAWDSILFAVGALGVLAAEFATKPKPNKSIELAQKVGKGGTGIQAGRDITINR